MRLVRWPTPDWYNTPAGYRFIKAGLGKPIELLARIQYKGENNIPDTGAVILAPNHLTWADPIVLGVALKRPAFYLAKEGLFRNPALGWFLDTMGQIKVERVTGGNDPAIETAASVAEQGLIIGVFPEGTRSRGDKVKRGKTGVARIAARTGAPVVPVGLATYDFWPRNAALPHLGRSVYVNIGKPVRFDLKPADEHDRDKMRAITDDVMARVKALLDEALAAQRANVKWR